MLTVEQNEELTRVGPGTPMGELLRRYWYPIAFEQDFDDVFTKSVRLLGENWTLFKTPKSGRYGIVAEACPHRRASLTYGVVHEDGIRCGYHGWKWDFDGTCLEQPAEADNQNFRDRVRQKAGKAEVMGGMVWVYVGPDPAPELPRFDVFVMDGVKDCGYATLPCNWLRSPQDRCRRMTFCQSGRWQAICWQSKHSLPTITFLWPRTRESYCTP